MCGRFAPIVSLKPHILAVRKNSIKSTPFGLLWFSWGRTRHTHRPQLRHFAFHTPRNQSWMHPAPPPTFRFPCSRVVHGTICMAKVGRNRKRKKSWGHWLNRQMECLVRGVGGTLVVSGGEVGVSRSSEAWCDCLSWAAAALISFFRLYSWGSVDRMWLARLVTDWYNFPKGKT